MPYQSMTDQSPLAAIVQHSAADAAIATINEEGFYDSRRQIQPYGPNSLAIPITEEPTAFEPLEICEQSSPQWRVNTLDERLQVAGLTARERSNVPNSWAVLGEIILGDFSECPKATVVGRELLALHGNAHTVLSLNAITGPHREPDVTLIAGKGQTETVHIEHGTAYALDLAKVMFSPGNKAERKRMGNIVSPDETVFDMFAGIGYFTLPMARAGASVIATERNPNAAQFLAKNVALNEVTSAVQWYRTDCRALRPRADRIVMGHYDAIEYLDEAMMAILPDGVIHLHAVVEREDRWSKIHSRLESASGDRSTNIFDRRVVKSHSPGMDHVVCDIRVD